MTRAEDGRRVRRQILEAIDSHWDEHERGPTLPELASQIGLSKTQIVYHLKLLREEGKVTAKHRVGGSLRTR